MAIVMFMEDMPVKRIKFVLVMAMVILFLSGCSKPLLKTDTQSDNAAEYIAGIMLKYSKNYNDTLIYETPEPVVEENDTEKEITTSTENNNTNNNTSNKENSNNKNNNSNSNAEENSETNFKEFFKQYNVEVTYKTHKFYDTYPENVKDPIYALSAGKDKKLLVIEFTIKNKSDKKIELDLFNENLVYHLQGTSEGSYKPLLSVLSVDDLQFLKKTIKAKESCDALLIFDISDKVDQGNSEMYLTVTKDGKSIAKEYLK